MLGQPARHQVTELVCLFKLAARAYPGNWKFTELNAYEMSVKAFLYISTTLHYESENEISPYSEF